MKNARYVPLEAGAMYHVYNRGNNSQPVFLNPCDYHSFLERWERFIWPVAETFAFCLLENHFHAAIRIRDSVIRPDTGEMVPLQPVEIRAQFQRFFTSFAKSQHLRNDTNGAVFKRRFQRSQILTEDHFKRIIAYILLNPQKHRISGDSRIYPYSSYRFLDCRPPDFLAQDELVRLFGGADAIQTYLEDYQSYYFLPKPPHA